MARFVVLANPDCRRLRLFECALQKLGLSPPVVVPYAALLRGEVRLAQVLRADDTVRIESPGRDFEVERLLLARGASEAQRENRFRCIESEAALQLEEERGRLHPSRQWFLGLRSLFEELQSELDAAPPHRAMHDARHCLEMSDKIACHARLLAAGVPVAPALGAEIENFEALLSVLKERGWNRVFVKLSHGSSASGVVALQMSRGRVLATTTTEMVEQNGEIRLYNSRRVRRYQTWREVEVLIDALCRERVHVERWLPKASLGGRVCDVRLVIIDGQARQGKVRLSRGPLTNLHLGNERAPLEALKSRLTEEKWGEIVASCGAAMRAYPHSLMGGADLVFSPDFRRHAIIELNAWGDLLPDARCEGRDTYEDEIRAVAYFGSAGILARME